MGYSDPHGLAIHGVVLHQSYEALGYILGGHNLDGLPVRVVICFEVAFRDLLEKIGLNSCWTNDVESNAV